MQQLPLIERAIAHGDRLAICSSSQSCTYMELVHRSASMAALLLDGKNDLREKRVAYLIPSGDATIATQWGIWRAGGMAVPLSLFATKKELEYALIDSQASDLVTTGDFTRQVSGLCQLHEIRLLDVADSASSPHVALPEISLDRRAMMLYTSGTTSSPKGVVTTHHCIQAQIESLVDAWCWQMEDRIPSFLPLHHIHGIINIVSCALWSGAEIEAFSSFDLNIILRRVAQKVYTVFMAVPTIYVKLIEALEALSADERQPVLSGFAGMRLMISGSAALPANVHKKWTELTGQQLLERYGMTEIGMALSNPYYGERRGGTVGQPLPNVEIRLMPEQGKTITEENISGEIQVRGPNVFLEYWNRPEATRESFVDGWFRTGDIAVIEDNYYRIMGRNSVDIIKSGGYKLSALEIEAALLDHPAIAQCAVVGIPDDTWGERVAAAVVLIEGRTVIVEEIRKWCTGRISHYKVPREWLFTDQLPRNAMGKVTKPTVQKMFGATSAPPEA